MKGYNCVTFTLPQGRYHVSDTIVCRVIKCSDGTHSVYLNHGGWLTMSTAKAMNKALVEAGIGPRVFRKKGSLFFSNNNIDEAISESGYLAHFDTDGSYIHN